MHEIHRPTLVRCLGYRQRFWLSALYAALGFNAQIQFQFSINPVHPFVIPTKSFDVAEMQKAQPKSPVALIVGQSNQVIGNLIIDRQLLRLVAITSLANTKGVTG
jgi:hypothetical protein